MPNHFGSHGAHLQGLLGDPTDPAPILFLLSLFCHVTVPSHRHSFLPRSSAWIDNMMTRENQELVSPLLCHLWQAHASSKGARRSKQLHRLSPKSQSIHYTKLHIQPERVPLASAQPVQHSLPLHNKAAIISGVVTDGVKVAGIFSDVPPDSSKEDHSNQASYAQGSVAAVIQDITGEQNSLLVNQINSNATAHNVSVVSVSLVGAIDRPELVHEQMAIPLAFRISDKIQSKI